MCRSIKDKTVKRSGFDVRHRFGIRFASLNLEPCRQEPMSADISNVRPEPDKIARRHRRLCARATNLSARGVSKPRAIASWIRWAAACWRCRYPACTKLLGPVVPGADMPGGARVPGTAFELDPVAGRVQHRRAWSAGWISTTPGWPPSGATRPTTSAASWPSPTTSAATRDQPTGKPPLTMRDVLTAMIKAHEIQGVLALENSFNRVGLDHVLLVRVASTAVATAHARRHAGADHQRPLQRLDRRRRAAHLPPRAQHRLAQIAGRPATRPAAPCGWR